MLDSIKRSVGTEDPAYKAYLSTVAACRQVKEQFNGIISKGKVVEGFDAGALKRLH